MAKHRIYAVDGSSYQKFSDLNDALDCIRDEFYGGLTNSCTIDIEYVEDEEYEALEAEEM